MPTFKPKMSDGPEFKKLLEFAGQKTGEDPWLAASLPGVKGLIVKLQTSIQDIKDSWVEADEIELTDEEAAALIFFGGEFCSQSKGDSAAVSRICNELFRAELLKKVLGREVGPNRLALVARKATKVFLVHGRDRKALLEVRHWLKEECGLEISLMEAEKAEGSLTLSEALEGKMAGCGTVIVLATPDDLGSLKEEAAKSHPRARQNVILELGWMIGLLGRNRVIVLLQDSLVADFPSDFAGVTTIRFSDDIRTTFDSLRKKLQSMGVIVVRPNSR